MNSVTSGCQQFRISIRAPRRDPPSEILVPLIGALVFDGRDSARNAFHHLFGFSFYRLGYVFGQALDFGSVAQLDGHTAGAARRGFVHRGYDSDLALTGLGIDTD